MQSRFDSYPSPFLFHFRVDLREDSALISDNWQNGKMAKWQNGKMAKWQMRVCHVMTSNCWPHPHGIWSYGIRSFSTNYTPPACGIIGAKFRLVACSAECMPCLSNKTFFLSRRKSHCNKFSNHMCHPLKALGGVWHGHHIRMRLSSWAWLWLWLKIRLRLWIILWFGFESEENCVPVYESRVRRGIN